MLSTDKNKIKKYILITVLQRVFLIIFLIKLINQALKNLPKMNEWLSSNFKKI